VVHPSFELMKRKTFWEVALDICQDKEMCSTGGIKFVAPPEYQARRKDFYEWVFNKDNTGGFPVRKKIYQLRRDNDGDADILSNYLESEDKDVVPPSTFFSKKQKKFICEPEGDISIALETVSWPFQCN
jgi:hypothetical protein